MQQASAVVRISPANGVKPSEGYADFKQTAGIISRPHLVSDQPVKIIGGFR
ncbi:hypothetical protein [Chryseobacterium camelliae]|uniref:hypothetical protein n=1 Tax=Chryseobacterium camelliae TaxID=1265445 RepID=UPI002865A5D9|nr:hypothetical protein [Chryseobacterium camelliae]MDR6516749.1 hypothetical protein [Chryseobacterium camelliae]